MRRADYARRRAADMLRPMPRRRAPRCDAMMPLRCCAMLIRCAMRVVCHLMRRATTPAPHRYASIFAMLTRRADTIAAARIDAACRRARATRACRRPPSCRRARALIDAFFTHAAPRHMPIRQRHAAAPPRHSHDDAITPIAAAYALFADICHAMMFSLTRTCRHFSRLPRRHVYYAFSPRCARHAAIDLRRFRAADMRRRRCCAIRICDALRKASARCERKNAAHAEPTPRRRRGADAAFDTAK